MKNPILIVLLFTHIMGNTEFSHLLSLPKLVTHYQEHKQWNNQTSFISFITKHYLGNDGIDGDDKQDKDLPFRHYVNVFQYLSAAPPSICSVLKLPPISSFKTFPHLKQNRLLPVYATALLRPPRMFS